ncbi:hypothetical protein JCM10296v2_001414 [Rhodotorula toruloides]
MRTATPLVLLASAATAFASISPAPIPKDANPVSLPANVSLDKRNFCFLGVCIGGTDYSNDLNNCGWAGHKCPSSWVGGGGSQCLGGICLPSYCNHLWDLDSLTGQCRDVSSDASNCGKCGQTCNVENAATTTCISGQCYASACKPGYTLSSGTCTKNIDTTCDVNNCGSIGKKCPSSWSHGSGSTCIQGVCQPQSCDAGYAFDPSTSSCRDVTSDTSNCGAVGNACPSSNGVPQCSNGKCSMQSCSRGYNLVNGACQQANLQTDTNNCGSVGNKCPSSFPNGVGSTCVNGICQAQSCNTGCMWHPSAKACLDVTNDPNNCGSIGNICPSTNGQSTCNNGQCALKSCNSGYYLLNGVCTKLNLQTDTNNCGSLGTQCKVDNGVASCSSGTCSISSCNPGYQLQSSGWWWWATQSCEKITCAQGFDWDSKLNQCRDVRYDTNNCGGCGNVCPSVNGEAACYNGQCSMLKCSWGFTLVDGKCNGVDTQNDPNNCGSVGHACPRTFLNGGEATCKNGVCSTICNSGFDFDFGLGFCRDVHSDSENCGRCGQKCQLPGACVTGCKNGQCYAISCDPGYTLQDGACKKIDTTCDPNNCGALGKVCTFSPPGAQGVCQNGKCTLTSCPAGYKLDCDVCVKLGPSQGAHWKRNLKASEPKRLCPGKNEQACPITGSTTFDAALEHHFNAASEFSGVMLGTSGYECIDTQQALDSCGGCASTGEGLDCMKIRGAAGVGCESGRCVVFSCRPGWKPSISGDKCVRLHPSGSKSGNSTSTKHTKRRHVQHRQKHLLHAHHSS